MDISLESKKAIVCGSTSGIGKATAKVLAGLGAEIVLVARNEEKLINTLSELPAHSGQEHRYLCVDFSEPESLEEAVHEYTEGVDEIQILVNNTGGPLAGDIMNAEKGDFAKAFRQHIICNQILVKAVVPFMKEVGYGRIVNVVSTSVKIPIPGLGVSNTIRGAVANWAKTLAGELGEYGITVNNVLPGSTWTARLKEVFEYKAKSLDANFEDIKESTIREIPAKRLASPEEIGQAIAFLASPAAAYINGINLPVDGGKTGCL